MIKKKFPLLYSPLKIGPVTSRNRIESAPMSMTELGPNEVLSAENIAFYREMAKGGAGIVTVGESIVRTDCGKTHAQMLMLGDPKVWPSLCAVTDAIHEFGALASIEISHGGQMADPIYNNGNESIGPTDHIDEYGDHIIGMTEEMMDDVAEAFAEAAETCKKCGFDMVQIHVGHGWLLGQFLSPLTNTRTDKYGGSMENRARFPAMVVERVRQRVGRNFALDMRISGAEFVEGGSTIEDAVNFVKTVEKWIDLVNISAGAPWWPHMIPSVFDERGFNAPLAAEVRKHVKIPVTSVGGYVDPNHMESLLEQGVCDGFIIGHGLVADPQLPNKGLLGKDDEIRPCMRCGVCNQLMYSTREFKCSINPLAGRYSSRYDEKPASVKKKVLVVGGGPGGMQCAITAAERGHDVTLAEKSDRLGGALKFADHVGFKVDMKTYRDWLIRTVERMGVKVLLNTEVTPEWAEKFAPDALAVAIGAEPVIPPIPGVKGGNVVLSVNMFDDDVQLGKKVVIIGGGLVGCEDGLQLAYDGHDVTIVEMMGEVAADAPPKHKGALLPRLYDNTTVLTNSACAEITDNGIWCSTPEGKKFIEADTVVLAAGSKALSAQVDALRDVTAEFHIIGDCNKARRVLDAVRSGYDAAVHM